VPPLSHLTSSTPSKCNLYFETSFATVIYSLLSFDVPNRMSTSLGLGRTFKQSVQIQGPLWHFVTSLFFYGEELLAQRPTLKLKDHHLLAVRDCVFNIFAATLHNWRPSPPSTTEGRAMPWWHETHLTWRVTFTESCKQSRPFSLNDPQQSLLYFGT
jgi:hypothetical protein